MNRLEGWAYLCGVSQEYEADIILGLLNEQGIPTTKDHPGAGEFLKIAYGLANGVDIYVPKAELEKAQELLEHSVLNQGEDINDPSVEPEARGDDTVPPRSKGIRYPWSLLIIIMIILLAMTLLLRERSLFWNT
ncbi:MAG: putative signal transducing protein [Desulfitobacteriaceae bacterium]